MDSWRKNYNPLALMYEDTSESIWKRNQFIGKATLEVIKGLLWNMNYSWSNYQSTYSAYDTRNSQLEGIGNKNGQAVRNTYFGHEQTFETYLNYGFTAGKHKVDLMAGYTWEQKKNNDGFGLAVEGYYNDDLKWYNNRPFSLFRTPFRAVMSRTSATSRSMVVSTTLSTAAICCRPPSVATVRLYSVRTSAGVPSRQYQPLGTSLRRAS